MTNKYHRNCNNDNDDNNDDCENDNDCDNDDGINIRVPVIGPMHCTVCSAHITL